MMEREIKFRAWRDREMVEFELGDCLVDRNEKILDFRSIPVMQFTGLKDKNGNEIYEGDIVKYWNRETHPIVYHNNGFYIQYGSKDYFSMQYENKECEVVGNIFENPELLTH